MSRYSDMPPEQRALSDRLYEPLEDGSLWRGPCGHPASSMWVRGDLLVECAAHVSESHVASAEHFLGWCGPDCIIEKCGTLYRADALPPARP